MSAWDSRSCAQFSQPTTLFPMPGQAGVATGDQISGFRPRPRTRRSRAGPRSRSPRRPNGVNIYKGAERSAAIMQTQGATDSARRRARRAPLQSAPPTTARLNLVLPATERRHASSRRRRDGDTRHKRLSSTIRSLAIRQIRVPSRSVFCADINSDGRADVIVHRTAQNAASCAYRCYELGRWGYDLARVDGSGNPDRRVLLRTAPEPGGGTVAAAQPAAHAASHRRRRCCRPTRSSRRRRTRRRSRRPSIARAVHPLRPGRLHLAVPAAVAASAAAVHYVAPAPAYPPISPSPFPPPYPPPPPSPPPSERTAAAVAGPRRLPRHPNRRPRPRARRRCPASRRSSTRRARA